MKLLLPKTKIKEFGRYEQTPIFYLAGPILGGGDWQQQAIKHIVRFWPASVVVCPVRYPEDHPLMKYRMSGDEDYFERQTDWEDFYMKRAIDPLCFGCLIFWLPCESSENPRPRASGPYAQDTYGELGYWRRFIEESQALPESRRRGFRISIGAERDFPGFSKIMRDIDRAMGAPSKSFPFNSSLEGTISRAIEIADVPRLRS